MQAGRQTERQAGVYDGAWTAQLMMMMKNDSDIDIDVRGEAPT
jgi:hypothetical protein